MNTVELLLLLIGSLLSILFGTYFVSKIGWWGVFPAAILGFGLVVGLIFGLNRMFLRRKSKRSDQK
jgi:uncharacterized membrane protein